MSANYSTKKGWTSKKGAFVEGIWRCDCGPRLPAEKFQTKNGGRNHGRWFFTCQLKKCGFFIWADDAKVREKGALLSNSRSEPGSVSSPSVPAVPQTPKKTTPIMQQPTPDTRTRKRADSSQTVDFEPEEFFDWPSSDDEALTKIAAQASADLPPPQPVFETPCKAAKTAENTSPAKRTHNRMLNESSTMVALQNTGNIFITPLISNESRNSRLVSPSPTPAQRRSQADQMQGAAPAPSTLAQEVLEILSKNPMNLVPSVERELVDLLNKHDLRTQGIAKGRELSRVAVVSRERHIAELQNRIAGLEMEKKSQRQVNNHLNHDMATSPTKSPYPRSPYRGRGKGGFTTPRKREV